MAMVAEKRRRHEFVGANAGRYDRNSEPGFFTLPRAPVATSASLQHPHSTGLQRLPSVSSFLRPPPVETITASAHGRPPLDLSIQIPQARWTGVRQALTDPTSARAASMKFQDDYQAPSPNIMRTRRRFSPRSRLRASKRLGSHLPPSWSRPVGISISPSRPLLLREGGTELHRQRHELQRQLSQEPSLNNEGIDGNGGKSSRYLREADRRQILSRIERGEKQSALAKEFRVTRAAICNLNKHRALITSSPNTNPMATHPKRSKSTPRNSMEDQSVNSWRGEVSNSATGVQLAPSTRLPDPESVQVYHVTARSVQMLLALMQDASASDAALEHHSVRVMTCLIEEAVAWVYSSPGTRGFSLDDYFARLPPCGVAVDEIGRLFLDRFHAMEPRWGTGIIELADHGSDRDRDSDSDRESDVLAVVHIDLPAALPACTVFLLLAFVRGAASARLRQSVRILLEHGVLEELLCLVALGVSRRAVRALLAEFPRLRVATAAVDMDASTSETSSQSGSSQSSSSDPSADDGRYDNRQPGTANYSETQRNERRPSDSLAVEASGSAASATDPTSAGIERCDTM